MIIGGNKLPLNIKMQSLEELKDGSMNVEVELDEDSEKEVFSQGIIFLLLKGMFELNDNEVVVALTHYKKQKDRAKDLEDSLDYWHEGPIE